MVKREPNLLRTRLIVLFWLCVMIVFVIYYPFYTDISLNTRFMRLFVFTILGLVNVFSALSAERYWRKQEQRRKRAVHGDAHLLAAQQPSADDASLVLPLTITQRIPKRWTIVLVVALTLLLAVLIPTLIISTISQSKSLSDVAISLLFSILIFGMLFIFLVIPFLQCYQKLVVDEQGMHVRVGLGRVHFVRWEEARLFAISSAYQRNNKGFSGQKIDAPFYEISSTDDIARWQWLHDNSKVLFNISEPTIPFTEYDKQMQALLSLIAAKTHLVLYNVRPMAQK